MSEDKIEITNAAYQSLLTSSEWLECLEDAGVDNWGGMETAYRLLDEKRDAEQKQLIEEVLGV